MKKYLIIIGFLFSALHANNELMNQAYQYVVTGDYQAADKIYQQLLTYYPDHADLLCNQGFVLRKQNKISKALTVYQKAQTRVPSPNSRIERAISHIYLTLGDFEHGWPAYEYRWVTPPSYNQDLKKYLEHGGSFQHKIVLLHAEYGLGDTLHFIRYAAELKKLGARVILQSQKQLVPLLSLCPYIDHVVSGEASIPAFDFEALLMSMPLIMHTTLATIPHQTPYLYAQPKLVSSWKQQLASDPHFKIGICWHADSHKNSNNSTVQRDAQEKSIPLQYLACLSELPGISVYSLQKIDGTDQLTALSRNCTVKTFEHLDSEHGPFMDTAALMQHLDLVITIDTSIAHLAGGLGIRTWVLLPYAADWRWLLDRTDSPWYPTMQLFRQSKPGDWASVIANVIQKLSELYQITKESR